MSRVLSLALERPALLLPLAALGLMALYLLAIDQGLLLSLFQGDLAFNQNLLHEALHDARHAAGFPCH